MTLTRDARDTVMERAQRDPEFVNALVQEAAALAREGESELAAHLLEPLNASRTALRVGADRGPGIDAEIVFARLNRKYLPEVDSVDENKL